jgi:hypothetical protein
MELYISNDQLKEFSDVLTGEKVIFEITDNIFSLVVDGKEIGEVTKVKAELLETEVPVIYDQGPVITLRAFRLPSGKKIILADAEGNFIRFVEPPPGWER